MAPRQTGLRAPATYVVSGVWPNAELSGPVFLEYAQAFARILVDQIGERSIRDVGRDAELSHSTLLAVLSGTRWPDMVTVAKLELALSADLWPGRKVRRELDPGPGFSDDEESRPSSGASPTSR